jgi:hypothetical protein
MTVTITAKTASENAASRCAVIFSSGILQFCQSGSPAIRAAYDSFSITPPAFFAPQISFTSIARELWRAHFL